MTFYIFVFTISTWQKIPLSIGLSQPTAVKYALKVKNIPILLRFNLRNNTSSNMECFGSLNLRDWAVAGPRKFLVLQLLINLTHLRLQSQACPRNIKQIMTEPSTNLVAWKLPLGYVTSIDYSQNSMLSISMCYLLTVAINSKFFHSYLDRGAPRKQLSNHIQVMIGQCLFLLL